MDAPFGCGSATDEARDSHERSGRFKKNHAKLGGRKRGTPNALSPDYKKLLLEAGYRIGCDGNGKYGFGGYLRWVARNYPRVNAKLLERVYGLEDDTDEMPNEPGEFNRFICDHVGLSSTQPNSGPVNAARAGSRLSDTVSMAGHRHRKSSQHGWNWTGRDDETGDMMRLAVENPKLFCRLLGQAFLSAPKNRRRTERCQT